ncbi:MAG TPA: YbaB/EbfC family nucleoid-associated protein [Candidatus Scybalousia intestinigallinarum]|nr:YbaB/EbfC family nucleoid-associated protein [Candidatus Scybalousia intestinigallinarum]
MNLQAIMKQAQAMQKDMMKAKEEVDNTTFIGESSFVKVEVKGTKEVVKITIEEELSDIDKEMLADMIMIAINDAFKKVDKMMEQKLGRYANALPGVI